MTNGLDQSGLPVISCIAFRTLVSGFTVISLFCQNDALSMKLGAIHITVVHMLMTRVFVLILFRVYWADRKSKHPLKK